MLQLLPGPSGNQHPRLNAKNSSEWPCEIEIFRMLMGEVPVLVNVMFCTANAPRLTSPKFTLEGEICSVVVAAVTVCGTPLEVLVLKLVSPE